MSDSNMNFEDRLRAIRGDRKTKKKLRKVSTRKVVKTKKSSPKLKRELKTNSRLFRFTETNSKHLANLALGYKTNVSKIMDILIETSKMPECKKLLDKCVEQMSSA